MNEHKQKIISDYGRRSREENWVIHSKDYYLEFLDEALDQYYEAMMEEWFNKMNEEGLGEEAPFNYRACMNAFKKNFYANKKEFVERGQAKGN